MKQDLNEGFLCSTKSEMDLKKILEEEEEPRDQEINQNQKWNETFKVQEEDEVIENNTYNEEVKKKEHYKEAPQNSKGKSNSKQQLQQKKANTTIKSQAKELCPICGKEFALLKNHIYKTHSNPNEIITLLELFKRYKLMLENLSDSLKALNVCESEIKGKFCELIKKGGIGDAKILYKGEIGEKLKIFKLYFPLLEEMMDEMFEK